MMIPYAEPEKLAKLEEAIQRGFITRTTQPDGILFYELTPRGLGQWNYERTMKSWGVKS